jgi:hypothetical protein
MDIGGPGIRSAPPHEPPCDSLPSRAYMADYNYVI